MKVSASPVGQCPARSGPSVVETPPASGGEAGKLGLPTMWSLPVLDCLPADVADAALLAIPAAESERLLDELEAAGLLSTSWPW